MTVLTCKNCQKVDVSSGPYPVKVMDLETPGKIIKLLSLQVYRKDSIVKSYHMI